MLSGTFRSYFGAIAVPILDAGDGTRSTVTHEWAAAAGNLGGGLAVNVLRLQLRNRRVDFAKEKLAEQAIKNNCQWILFIDDDTIPPQDALMKMIKLWRSDPKYKMISGVYWSKSDPAMPLIFDGDLHGSVWDWKVGDLFQADAGGAGMLFIDTEMLKKMSKPWFSCDYYFEDPRAQLDIKAWQVSEELGQELLKNDKADPKKIEELHAKIAELGAVMQKANEGQMDPNLVKNKPRDGATTEDLYFFKKAREELGIRPWFDTSIQCPHQDKKSGKTFGITDQMPQSKPRYEGRMKPGNAIVLDIGSGDANYYMPDGVRITVDLDPKMKPDVLCDARELPFEDCFADVVFSSHLLEHFSWREVITVIKEWIRVTKVGGKMIFVVPNLKWAADRLLSDNLSPLDAQRAMFMFHSAQKGDLKEAHTDYHKAGYTPESFISLLKRIPGLEEIEVYTTDANYDAWDDEQYLHEDGKGYNIIAFAKKSKHSGSVSLKMPIAEVEESMQHMNYDAPKDPTRENFDNIKKVIEKKRKKVLEQDYKPATKKLVVTKIEKSAKKVKVAPIKAYAKNKSTGQKQS